MKRILFIVALLPFLVKAQSINNQKVRWMQPIYMGSNTAATVNSSSDTGAFFFDRSDSVLYFKYKGAARAIGYAGASTVDSSVYSTRAWRQKGVDSLNGLISARVMYSDTASMLNNYVRSGSLGGYVPYSGASSAVDLGTNGISTRHININGDNSSFGGFVGLKQFSSSFFGGSGYTSLYALNNNIAGITFNQGATNKTIQFNTNLISSNTTRTYSMPNGDGTLALSTDIGQQITDSLKALVRLRASGSGGIQLQNSVGTNVADFGAANTTNGSIAGGWNVGGNSTISGTLGVTQKATFSDSIVGVNQRLTGVLLVGQSRLLSQSPSLYNLFLGHDAGNTTLTGSENTGFGYRALTSVTGGVSPAGSFNTAFGSRSGESITTGSKNSSFGRETLDALTTGVENTAIGYGSTHSLITGNYNTALGFETLHEGTGFSNNTAIGYRSLFNVTGNNNTAVGLQSGQLVTSGQTNTFVGVNSGYGVTTGSDNTAIGYNAGVTANGSANIFLGQSADANTGLNNVTVIGTGLKATTSNTLILGNSQNVLIGYNSDNGYKLDVNGLLRASSYYLPSSLLANQSTNYNALFRRDGVAGVTMGGSGDQKNYYDNDSHVFRSANGSSTYATIGTNTSISGALTATAQGNNITVGVDSSVTSTSYTLVLGDAGYLKRCSNASAITITVPTNASVAFPIGTTIYFSQQGAGKVSVSPATSDVTIQSEGNLLGTAGQHAVIALIKVNSNRWLLCGNRG